ncbi:hypothetical protein INT45_012601 [Circinella minor]|uniref:Uncharacterized protein n=1 Tax=Circinella minor TaxID=1195481 RepID=A0A8H7RP93_9FUNG|nr:hypothetical protein INT45_012601 [Circinella minor]
MNQDNTAQLITSFIQTIADFKVHVNNAINILDQKLDKIEYTIHSRLELEVGALKSEINDLKTSLLEQLDEGRVVPSPLAVEYPRVNSDHNPFANQKLAHNVMAPYQIRAQHNIDSTTTWAVLSEKTRREAESLFEKLVDDEFPLRACVENWGAKLIMRKAFLKHSEREETSDVVDKCVTHSIPNIDYTSEAESYPSYNGNDVSDRHLLDENATLFYDDAFLDTNLNISNFDDERLELDAALSSDEEDDIGEKIMQSDIIRSAK